MLTLMPARRRRAGSGKLGIALAGGGRSVRSTNWVRCTLSRRDHRAQAHGLRRLCRRELWLVRGCGSGEWLRHRRHGGDVHRGRFDAVALSPGILMQPAVAEYLRRLALLPQVLPESCACTRATRCATSGRQRSGHSPSCFRPRCSTTDRRTLSAGAFWQQRPQR